MAYDYPGWEFILPASFDPLPVLPPELHRYADEACFLVNTIIRKTISRKVDSAGYARLNTGVLRETISRKRLTSHLGALVHGEVLDIEGRYRPGQFSKGYRLKSHFLQDDHLTHRPTYRFLVAKLARFQCEWEEEQRRRRTPVHDYLNWIQTKHVSIDLRRATALIGTMCDESRLCQGVLARNLALGTPTHSVGGTGRYFNGLTGLARALRHTVSIAGESMVSLDLVCCQPALLALLMSVALSRHSKGATYKQVGGGGYCSLENLLPGLVRPVSCSSDELADFCSLVCGGVFYEWLASETCLGRTEVKVRFLVDILAPKWVYPAAVRRVFGGRFPSVLKFIDAVNRTEKAELIRALQRCESWLVLGQVAPKLMGVCPFLTLHDSIFSRERDVDLVRLAYEQTFGELNFAMGLKEESWGASGLATPVGNHPEPTPEQILAENLAV